MPKKKSQEEKEIKISNTDPESGYYVKGEREKQFAYSFHTACDTNGFILSSITILGNIHDSQLLIPLIEKLKNTLSTPSVVVADAKEKHGMKRTTYRRLAKVTLQGMLTFVAMNLKKMANCLWKRLCLFIFLPINRKKRKFSLFNL